MSATYCQSVQKKLLCVFLLCACIERELQSKCSKILMMVYLGKIYKYLDIEFPNTTLAIFL